MTRYKRNKQRRREREQFFIRGLITPLFIGIVLALINWLLNRF
ncbi:hypothetical protein [Listeria newyorkensis]|nr:hypothetical protein [Listeria newyorkensis]